jgi:glycosyltransferase-like protein
MTASRTATRALRIGLLTHSTNPRGGVVHTVELAHALHDLGHDVTVMAPAAPGQRFFRPLRCRTELIPAAPAQRDVVAMVGSRIAAIGTHLGELLRHRDFDILHTHDPIGGNALADLVAQGVVGGFTRTVHHLEVFPEPRLMALQERGFRAASQVLCVSAKWRDVLARMHGVAAHEVPNGVDNRRFSAAAQPGEASDAALACRLGIRPGAPVVLAVGGVEERKNTVRLLEAFVLLRRRWPAAQLVVAGGASLLDHAACRRAFDALAEACDLQTGPRQPIVVTGPLADADMPGLYRLADVVAMPSLNEGFGLVVLEALASGVPVAVSRIAPFTGYLRDDDCCWADPLDARSIADALLRAIAERSPARIAQSAARLGAQFNWPASAVRHALLYERQLASARARDAAHH